MILDAIELLSKGRDLTAGQMALVMEEIMSGQAIHEEIVTFLTHLSKKGETPAELAAAVSVMRRFAVQIKTKHKVVLDTCGTGGDCSGTFNISTAVAFVVSGAGVVVAKHGNRAVSSRSGSADTLEALGINIHLNPQMISKCLDEIGIAFLFAQNLHPAMKYAMSARKEIKSRTIFNLLGPLSNPASATHQLIGVYHRRWVEVLAEALKNLGAFHALVVHGSDGLDEITTTGTTFIVEAKRGKIIKYDVSPGDFGFRPAVLSDLAGGVAADNAKIILEILNGKKSCRRDIVILNAGAALYAADKAASIKEGILLAEESIDSGDALMKLNSLKEYAQL